MTLTCDVGVGEPAAVSVVRASTVILGQCRHADGVWCGGRIDGHGVPLAQCLGYRFILDDKSPFTPAIVTPVGNVESAKSCPVLLGKA